MGGRPDFATHARQQRSIAEFVGETAYWRIFVSGSNPTQSALAAGLGDEPNYVFKVITGLFSQVSPAEILQAGGTLIAGDMNATLVDATPAPDDAIIWRGIRYTVVSDTIQQPIIGSSALRFILRRGQP